MSTQNAVSHTPGPWHSLALGTHVRAADHSGIAKLATRNGNADEQAANARLIAAAPDMLEALREAWDQFEQMEKMFRDDLEFMGALSAVRAAVAKAEAQS